MSELSLFDAFASPSVAAKSKMARCRPLPVGNLLILQRGIPNLVGRQLTLLVRPGSAEQEARPRLDLHNAKIRYPVPSIPSFLGGITAKRPLEAGTLRSPLPCPFQHPPGYRLEGQEQGFPDDEREAASRPRLIPGFSMDVVPPCLLDSDRRPPRIKTHTRLVCALLPKLHLDNPGTQPRSPRRTSSRLERTCSTQARRIFGRSSSILTLHAEPPATALRRDT